MTKRLKCGDEVITKVGGIHGMVSAVTIRFKDISYEIMYYQDSEHKLIQLHREEIEPYTGKKKMGF